MNTSFKRTMEQSNQFDFPDKEGWATKCPLSLFSR